MRQRDMQNENTLAVGVKKELKQHDHVVALFVASAQIRVKVDLRAPTMMNVVQRDSPTSCSTSSLFS